MHKYEFSPLFLVECLLEKGDEPDGEPEEGCGEWTDEWKDEWCELIPPLLFS